MLNITCMFYEVTVHLPLVNALAVASKPMVFDLLDFKKKSVYIIFTPLKLLLTMEFKGILHIL